MILHWLLILQLAAGFYKIVHRTFQRSHDFVTETRKRDSPNKTICILYIARCFWGVFLTVQFLSNKLHGLVTKYQKLKNCLTLI